LIRATFGSRYLDYRGRRKFKAKFAGMERRVPIAGCVVSRRGAVAGDLLLCEAQSKEDCECSLCLVTQSEQAPFLNAEIVKLPLLSEEDLRVEQSGARIRVSFILEIGSQFETADSVDSHFERRNAPQTPFGIGQLLSQRLLFIRLGRVAGDKTLDVSLVDGSIFGGQYDGATGEARAKRVQRGGGFALHSSGAGGELRVLAIGSQARVRDRFCLWRDVFFQAGRRRIGGRLPDDLDGGREGNMSDKCAFGLGRRGDWFFASKFNSFALGGAADLAGGHDE